MFRKTYSTTFSVCWWSNLWSFRNTLGGLSGHLVSPQHMLLRDSFPQKNGCCPVRLSVGSSLWVSFTVSWCDDINVGWRHAVLSGKYPPPSPVKIPVVGPLWLFFTEVKFGWLWLSETTTSHVVWLEGKVLELGWPPNARARATHSPSELSVL